MTQISLDLGGMSSVVQVETQAPPTRGRLDDFQAAARLDQAIDRNLDRTAMTLAKSLLELGAALARMHADKGYKLLGYLSWESYLASKRQHGRTYLSYLLKLGQAGEIHSALPKSIGPSQLVEYAKHTDYPERIPQLISETWPEVKELSVRQMCIRLKQHVAEHHETYRKPSKRPVLAKKRTKFWRRRFERQLSKLDPNDRADFLADLEAFLEDCRLQAAQSGEDARMR